MSLWIRASCTAGCRVAVASTSQITVECRRPYTPFRNRWFFERGTRPLRRTVEVVLEDFRRMKERSQEAEADVYRRKGIIGNVKRDPFWHELFPYRTDVLIVGGGVVGSAYAFWIANRMRMEKDFTVYVIESDDSFARSASIRGIGGIHHNFATKEQVEMSLFGAEFLRHAGEHLRILDADPVDIEFQPMGHLFLARTDEQADKMREDFKVQSDAGAKRKLLSPNELREAYPFLNFEGVRLGSIGLHSEGIFDSWSLLSALREKNLALGINYIKAKMSDVWFQWHHDTFPQGRVPASDYWKHRKIRGVVVQPHRAGASPRPVRCSFQIVNAAGPWSREISQMADMGEGPEWLSVPLPTARRKRYVFVLHAPDGPGLKLPMLIDESSGVWVRREGLGNTYICGCNPPEHVDSKMNHSTPLEHIDYGFYDAVIAPVVRQLVPGLQKAEIKNAWSSYVDVCWYDGLPVIGEHPFYLNMLNVCGFGTSGLMHAMAVGKCLSERLFDGAETMTPLTRFSFDRLMSSKRMAELVMDEQERRKYATDEWNAQAAGTLKDRSGTTQKEGLRVGGVAGIE